MANPTQRDYLGQAFEDIQQVKASTSVDGIKLNISKELVDTLKTVNDEGALVGQARLNAVAAKNLLREEQKNFENEGAHDKASVIATAANQLSDVLSDKKSGQTNDWLSELYTRIGRFQTQDILRIDNKEVADKSRPKLYAMGIRSQAQLDKILADDESKELASRIFNTMKIPGGGDLSTILGDGNGSTKTATKKQPSASVNSDIDTKKDILDKLDTYFSTIEKDIKDSCSTVCDLTKIDQNNKFFDEMLWVAYKLYTEAKDIKDPENVHAHFTDFRTSEQYKKTFIELFERDTKRMGVHLSEATAEGVKPVNEYSIKQESDSIVMRFNPDNMIEQVGQHRIKDKKASFLGADFGVTVKRGGIEEKVTPQITNGGKNYTVRIPKSELTGAESFKVNTPQLQPQIAYQGDNKVRMEAQTTWGSREVSINEKELNDLLGAAPISSTSTPTSSVDPVIEELPAPELEPAAPFKDDQFSIKGKIPGYDPAKKMDVEITLNKNGKRSMLKLPDPIIADDGTFVVDIDIFKHGINEGSFDVIAMTKAAGKESDDLVRTYEYDPTTSPLKMTGIGINGREITLQGETTHPSSEPSEIGYIKEGTTTYHRITALTKIGIGAGKWKYVFTLPSEGTYTVLAQVNSIGKTGADWKDNVYCATNVECKESPARPLIESPLDNTEITGNDLPLAGVAKDSDGPVEIKVSQNNGVTRTYKNINVSSDKWSRVITDLKGQGFKGGTIQVSIKSQAKSSASAWSSPITYRIPVEVVTKVDSFNIKEKQSVEIDADVESDWFVVKGTPGQTVHAFTVNGHFWNGTNYVDEGDIALSATGIYRTRVQVRSALTEKSATTMSLYVGDKSSEFKVTTKDAPVAATVAVENIDPITFAPQNNVEISTNTISNPEVISGITTPKAISVVAGQYRINGGAWVATPGTVSAGDIVEVAVTSSATHSDSKTAALNVGGKVSKFEVKTKADTTVPAPDTLNPFAFTVRNNIAPSTPVVSNQIVIAGITTPREVRIAGGQFRVNGGAWETAMRTVSTGDLVEVQVTSSPNYNDQSVATINIGGEVQRFEVNTMASAPTVTTEVPADFPFTPVTGAAISSPITSNEIVVRGITATASIAVANGEYRINGGGWTNAAGTVNNNDRVTVRLTSSATNSTAVDAKLFIGPKESTFSVTTAAAAAAVAPETPDDFNFTDVSSVALGQTIDSNAIPITGITGPVPITIGGGEYSINGGRWTNTPGTVDNNDVVEVRVLSANTFNTPRTATVNIGGRVKEFKVTTAPNYGATVETPFAYPFTARNDVPLDTNIDSNEIVVAGLAAAAAIAVANGEYRVNGGAWTNAPGTVNNGDRVTMRTRSPNLHSTKVTSQLNIGGGSSIFEVTTLVAHTAPRINNPHQTVGPNTQTFTISGDVQDPNVRAVTIYNGAVALQTVPLRSIRRNLLSRNATANAFSATFNRSVLNEGQLNNIRVVSIGANGAPIANAEAHATVMCEVPAGHVTITSPSQGATIEGGKVPFAGTKSATGVRVQVSRNTLGVKSGIQECAVDGNKWTRNIEGLSHGSHTFYFRELTADGTPGRRSKVSFKVNLPLEQRTFGGVRSRFKNLFGKKDKAGAAAGEGASATSADGTAAAAGSAEGIKGGGSMFGGLWANLKDDLLWVKKVAHDQPLDAMNKGTKVVTDTIKEPITIIPGYKKK